MYADVIVDIATGELDRVFQYRVPDDMENSISAGVRVEIPFGKGNRKIQGFVINTSSKPSYPEEKIKNIECVVNGGISVESQLITLASNIKTVYGSTMAAALKTVVPVKKQVRPVEHKSYRLNISLETAYTLLKKLEKDRRRASSAALLTALLSQGELSKSAVIQSLGISQAVIKSLKDKGIIAEEKRHIYRKPVNVQIGECSGLELNDEQRAAVEGILAGVGDVHLIHGITGSGKTEVYIALVAEMVARGQQVIVLIPEISLTFQTVSRFYQRFGDRVSIINSRLSAGERYDQYMRAKEGDVDIIVGPRSALFMPFEHLGMIIIDEEHDGAYKSESTPKYHAREVAIWRSKLCGATVVLGSATPSVGTYAKALMGTYHLHRLTKRAVTESNLPNVHIIDLREEFKLKNKKIFSHELTEMIYDRLAKKEQVMLFLNRRGFAGFVSCRSCGYVVKCRHCDVSMTAHYGGRLKCHYCGFEQPMFTVCPNCGSKYIAAFGTGTQKVETIVLEAFPEAKVLRLDRDSTSKKGSMDHILSDFKEGAADILIGTQMIVKGHDFPKVTLVGILAADLSMFSGDYLAAERTFQLLVQAAGRAGRGQLPGDVVIQTYQPEHYSIVSAAAQDYETFYRQEMIYRQVMNYPPFCHVLAVLGECLSKQSLDEAMTQTAELARTFSGLEIIGPASAFVAKAKDAFRSVLYVKCNKMRRLIELKNSIEQAVNENTVFNKIYIQFDMDPMSSY